MSSPNIDISGSSQESTDSAKRYFTAPAEEQRAQPWRSFLDESTAKQNSSDPHDLVVASGEGEGPGGGKPGGGNGGGHVTA